MDIGAGKPFCNLPSSLLALGAHPPPSRPAPIPGPLSQAVSCVRTQSHPLGGWHQPQAPPKVPHSAASGPESIYQWGSRTQPCPPAKRQQPWGPRPSRHPLQDPAPPTSSQQPPHEPGPGSHQARGQHRLQARPQQSALPQRRAKSAHIGGGGRPNHSALVGRGERCWAPRDISHIRPLAPGWEV